VAVSTPSTVVVASPAAALMRQILFAESEVTELIAGYGHIIVDVSHCLSALSVLSANSFEADGGSIRGAAQ